MLTIKKELSACDFVDEFSGLDNTNFADEHDALSIIYDSLASVYDELDENFISDYIRFQVQEMDIEQFIENYSHLLDLDEDANNDDKHEEIERVLNDNTYYIGCYEYNDTIYYLFDEF